MATSAHICYDSRRFKVNLQFIKELIEETGYKVFNTEWRGYGIVIPQILISTTIPFIIQIEDDPEWVPDEIKEFGKWAGLDMNSELSQKLAHCDARLAISSVEPDQVIDNGLSITVLTLGTAVDPESPEIMQVIKLVCSRIQGLLNDCVNGGLTQPHN